MSDLSPEERRQRIQQSLATLREILSPEDRKAIAEAVRQTRREDFPEDFDTDAVRKRFRQAAARVSELPPSEPLDSLLESWGDIPALLGLVYDLRTGSG